MALYAPRTRTACKVLVRQLNSAGLRTSVRLPDPAPIASLRYGVLPYATVRMSMANGKVPSSPIAANAVAEALRKLQTRFGCAALEFEGALLGALPTD